MKNGLIHEDGKLIYYENDKRVHAGVIKVGEDIYYISRDGVAVTGKYTVHSSMSNGLLKHGVYTFAEDGRLVEGSYVALKRVTSRRKRRKRKLASRPQKLSRYAKKRLLIIGLSVFLAMLLVTLGMLADNWLRRNNENQNPTLNSGIRLPEFKQDVILVSDGVLSCYSGEIPVSDAIKYGAPYKPLVFEYNLKGNDGALFYGEMPDFSDAKEIFMDGDKLSLELHNLKTGTRYYYKVVVNGDVYTGTFKTAASTRFIKVDGLHNARDIGGYMTQYGKLIKQGMIIRGTEVDGLVEPTYMLAPESLAYMRDTFGFVYDMDLRASHIFMGEYSSPFGEGVGHSFYTAPQYGGIFDEDNKECVRRIFSDLAKPENYPMYMHCTYGADRTGTVVFLLQAVLGMSEEQLVREYQLTGFFSSRYAIADECDIILSVLNRKEGDTLQERAVRFLVDDIGVTEAEIASIQDILLA